MYQRTVCAIVVLKGISNASANTYVSGSSSSTDPMTFATYLRSEPVKAPVASRKLGAGDAGTVVTPAPRHMRRALRSGCPGWLRVCAQEVAEGAPLKLSRP